MNTLTERPVEVMVGPDGSTKSAHAELLNRLSEMQDAPYYATARATLAEAEATIVRLERDGFRAGMELALKLCEGQIYALDYSGKPYRRPADAEHCAQVIRAAMPPNASLTGATAPTVDK